jgi:hypothetical protein
MILGTQEWKSDFSLGEVKLDSNIYFWGHYIKNDKKIFFKNRYFYFCFFQFFDETKAPQVMLEGSFFGPSKENVNFKIIIWSKFNNYTFQI